MTTPWGLPDFDAHEEIHFVTDEKCGLKAIIAVHSTHLGPAAGGARFWHYAKDDDALTDALRLSRGMSYKNAMAGLPLGGGKSVLLADADRTKTPDMLHAFGKAVDGLGGRYVTAEDVGINVADMIEVARSTKFVAGLPNSAGDVGGDPGPHTSLGVFLGHQGGGEARRSARTISNGLHIAHAGRRQRRDRRRAARLRGRREAVSIADVDQAKAQKLADATSGTVVSPDEILGLEADVLSPNALGAILTEQTIAALKVPVVAGGANNQLATPEDGERLHARGILYAPDYVINAGGIINVCTEYLGDGDASLVRQRIEGIPVRLEQIWSESSRDRPRSRRGRRCHGAAPDRQGHKRARRNARARQSRRFLRFARPATRWLLLIGLALAVAGMAAGPDADAARLSAGRDGPHPLHPRARRPGSAWPDGSGIAAASVSQLVWRHPLAAVAGRAVAPAGATFAAICLITGSIWGRPTWGTWWEWDGRLTSMLDPVLPLSRLHRARLGRARARRRRADRRHLRPGRRDQPADHPLFGAVVAHAPPGREHRPHRLDASTTRSCGRCR